MIPEIVGGRHVLLVIGVVYMAVDLRKRGDFFDGNKNSHMTTA